MLLSKSACTQWTNLAKQELQSLAEHFLQATLLHQN